MMTIKTKCENRKEMVQQLSEHLSTKAVYLRTPTYAFQLGRITVNRDASISGEAEDLLLVASFLAANGYLDEIPEELWPQTKSETEPKSEQTDANKPQPEFIRASIPLQDSTVKEVQNILRTLYARQDMINLMTQNSSIRIDEEVLDLINEATTTQQIEQIIRNEVDIGMVQGLTMEEGWLKVNTSYDQDNPSRWDTFIGLLFPIIDKAKKAHHVSSKRVIPSDGEMKYACRTWLLQLGLIGPEHKALRAALLNHLPGSAAFASRAQEKAHLAKRTQRANTKKAKEETE